MRRIVVLSLLLSTTPAIAVAQGPLLEEAIEWGAFAAVVGGVHKLDNFAQHEIFTEGGGGQRVLSVVGDNLGRRRTYYAGLGALFATGLATDNDALTRGSMRTAVAITASGLVTGGIKYLAGRPRPDNPDASGTDFSPLSSDDEWHSFPSGHVVTAFTMATAASMQIDQPWVAPTAYALASLVAWQRVHANRHWLSDVVGGAIIGVEFTEVLLPAFDAHLEGDEPESAGRPLLISVQFPLP